VIEAWFDGACEPINPGGTASWGCIIRWSDGRLAHRAKGTVGKGWQMSNNVAEYAGVIAILEWLDTQKIALEAEVRIYGDSQLVVNQLMGQWRVKKGLYVPYYRKAIELLKTRPNVELIWIPREDNMECDELSRQAGAVNTGDAGS